MPEVIRPNPFADRDRVLLASLASQHELFEIGQPVLCDPDAAMFVRSVAGGNETVPTVVIGEQPVVNPPPRLVVAVLRGA